MKNSAHENGGEKTKKSNKTGVSVFRLRAEGFQVSSGWQEQWMINHSLSRQ